MVARAARREAARLRGSDATWHHDKHVGIAIVS
jgi:hypothetical protein